MEIAMSRKKAMRAMQDRSDRMQPYDISGVATMQDLEILLERRNKCIDDISLSLMHLSRQEVIAILTSYVPLDELEQAMPTITKTDWKPDAEN